MKQDQQPLEIGMLLYPGLTLLDRAKPPKMKPHSKRKPRRPIR